MILVLSPRVAGPLATGLAWVLGFYRDPDPKTRQELAGLLVVLKKVANGGQSRSSFDPAELLAQAGRMKPLAVTFAEAGGMLACSEKGVQRHVRAGRLATIGDGPGKRVLVSSLEEFVSREARVEVAL